MPILPESPSCYRLDSATGAVLGYVNVESQTRWELLDRARQPGDPRRIVDLNRIWREVESMHSWNEPGWSSGHAETLLAQARQNGYTTQLSSLVQHAPDLLPTMQPEPSERRAALALVFSQIALHSGNSRLREAQWALERLAYLDLAAVYEHLASGSQRYAVLYEPLRAAFRVWHATISDDQRAWFFDTRCPEHLREAAMCDLLTFEADQRRRLRRHFREQASAREAGRALVESWFLRRYDLAAAEQLKAALASTEGEADEESGFLDTLPERSWRLASFSQGLTLAVGAAYLATAIALGLAWINVAGLEGWLPTAMILVYLCCGLPPLWFWLTSGRPDTSTPRLIAGILVALLGIVLQQNWDSLARFAAAQPAALAALSLGLLAASYKVMLTKIMRSTRLWRDQPQQASTLWERLARLWRGSAHKRCRVVWLRGLAFSFLLSLLLTDLLGNYYVTCLDALRSSPLCSVPTLPGALGNTFPGLVVLFTPLMLFGGVFTQLIWQETPITEALL